MAVFRNWLEPRILAAIVAVAGILWGFIEIAEAVAAGETRAIDTAILMALRSSANPADPLGPMWFQEAVRDITALGSPGVVGLVVAATAVFLLLSGRLRSVLFVLGATTGGWLAALALKELFGRPRPDLVAHGTHVYTASFPSGHAMIAAVVYLTLGALLARLLPSRVLKAYVMAVAVILTGLVGISRVFLGVHWPSDVLGGWAAGAAWALACWTVAQAVRLGRGELGR